MNAIPSMSLKNKAMKSLGRKILCVLLAGVFFGDTIALAEAPILPDAKAPAERHPLVQETANGIPLVNISAPTAGGVSRNDYERFNVPTKGAVLNNSYTLSQTELAGYVQGNANMAKGPAKIIVNQVTGANPTMMNGFLEVAGNKADVIIANHNGITVNGGGFIRTGRAILTTGKPEYDSQERLQNLRIDNDSTILVTGNGLNGKKADTLELYTRAADIQASIWGNTLQVTTGANTIDMTTGKVTAIEGKGKKPDVAIDVKALGGMYAGRIFLVANEKGLPIDLKGMIESQHMALDSEGNLYHTGTTHVTENLEIHAKDIQNNGTMAASTMTMTADGKITNDHILGSEENMTIHAAQLANHKTIASEKDLSITTSSQEENALDNANSEILANGNMTLTVGHVNNQAGTVAAGSQLKVDGNRVNNEQGKISSYGNANIQLSEDLKNSEGRIDSKQDLVLQAGTIQNTKGTLTAGQDETIDTKEIQLDGKLAAGNDLSLITEADITNENASDGYGITQAEGNLSISTKGKLTNTKKLEAKGILTLHAKDMTNTQDGSINGGTVSVTVDDNIENEGLISADEENTITADTLKNIETGRIYGENITIDADVVENRKDKDLEEKLSNAIKELQQKEKELDAAYAVDVTAFTNSSQQQAYFQTIEEKQTAYDTAKATVDVILAEMKNHSSAAIAARENLSIQGNSLLNSADALLYAGEDMALKEKQSIVNNGADIKALGNLSLTAPTITNENEAFSAKRVWTSHTTNPNRIRIDQKGHPEQGQVFDESEFSELGSGYGAYHNKGITPKELLEEAKYDKIEQITEEERKEGETPVPDNEVGKEAPNYDYDDPIFQEFGITSMSTPRPGYDDPQQAVWDVQYKEILAQLNEKIKAYNEEVKAYNQSIGAIESVSIKTYTIIRTTIHTSEKQVQETRAATISSGKDMTLIGNITNENSRILAGSTLMATGGTLENKAEQNQEQRITFGTTQESYTKKKHFPHKAWRRHYRDEIFMTPQEELENPTSLGVGKYASSTGDSPTKEDITQAMRDNVQQNLNPFATGKETTPGTTASKETGGTISFIPDNTLYKLHPEETAKYLVETDPAFTNKKKFLSSDYMYEQMLWDPDKMTKRLGDGFYEQELIRNQVSQLTGMRYLNGYTTDEEEYKALMDAGIAYAKEFHLTPGISLSKEQMASLTSDMVWMETTTVTVNGKTYDVLYPHVYLKAGSTANLTNDGTIISANTLLTDTKKKLTNEGTLQGNTILAKATTIVNHGTIFGDTIHLKAKKDIEHSGIIEGENNVTLEAGRNITMTDTIRHGKNQDILDTTAGIAVKGKEGVLLMEAGQNISLTGATLSALGEEGSMILHAGNNLTMDTHSLEAKKDMTENKDNYIRTYRKTETANTLTAGKDITFTVGGNIHARNTTIASENGAITAKAGKDLAFENGYNETKDDYGLQYKESGLLSHKTTTIKSHDETKTATGSLLSGDTVHMEAGANTTVKGSTLVGTHDVTLTAGKDTTIESAEEKEQHTYEKQVKKSGLMGSGLGFTIGKEKKNDQYKEADTLQKSSTVGSLQGNITINANKDIHVDASNILVGKDISLTGENVTITSKDNVYHSDEKHEYKKSGLTVSVSGGIVDVMTDTMNYAKKASSARDKQLKALYGGEVYETIAKGKDSLSDISEKGMPGIKVGIGSSSFQVTSHTETMEAVGSNLVARGDIQITAKKDIEMKGSTAIGDNISLKAGDNIHITAAENRSSSDIQESSKSSQAGVGVMPTGNTFYANSNKGKGKETEEIVTHTESQVIANKNLTTESGKDTSLIGSQILGDTVTMEVGNNLTIESVQDKDDYYAKNESKGMGLTVGTSKATHKDGTFSAGTTKG